jgi:DNA-directed RNA polymerase subunit omega
MAERLDTMMDPPVEELLDRCESKFSLVTLASKRARQINSYYGHLGDTSGQIVPPQVTSTARKPLSIAFEEIAADKVEGITVDLEDVSTDLADVTAAVESADDGD